MSHLQARLQIVSLSILTLTLSLFAMGEGPKSADSMSPDWSSSFPSAAKIEASGEYRGEIEWNVESFSPLTLEPSVTAIYQVDKGKHAMNFYDPVAGLHPSTAPPPDYARAEGSVCAIGWVKGEFRDLRMTGVVNAQPRPEGPGPRSRQGLMARWDLGNNFYWLYVDHVVGEIGIQRSISFGGMSDLKDSVASIRDFDSSKPYYLEFTLVGGTMEGAAYEIERQSWNAKELKKGRLVASVNGVTDPEPHLQGHSGFLVEISMQERYAPLEGSIARVTSKGIEKQ